MAAQRSALPSPCGRSGPEQRGCRCTAGRSLALGRQSSTGGCGTTPVCCCTCAYGERSAGSRAPVPHRSKAARCSTTHNTADPTHAYAPNHPVEGSWIAPCAPCLPVATCRGSSKRRESRAMSTLPGRAPHAHPHAWRWLQDAVPRRDAAARSLIRTRAQSTTSAAAGDVGARAPDSCAAHVQLC